VFRAQVMSSGCLSLGKYVNSVSVGDWAGSQPLLAPRTLAISLPYSSLERDFCRRRQTCQKGPEDDISLARGCAVGAQHSQSPVDAKDGPVRNQHALRVPESLVSIAHFSEIARKRTAA
jgi:hypothetical protein